MTDETLKFYEELTTAIQEAANKAHMEASLKIQALTSERDYYKRLAESYSKKQFMLDEWPGDKELMEPVRYVSNDIPNLLKESERKEFLRRLK